MQIILLLFDLLCPSKLGGIDEINKPSTEFVLECCHTITQAHKCTLTNTGCRLLCTLVNVCCISCTTLISFKELAVNELQQVLWQPCADSAEKHFHRLVLPLLACMAKKKKIQKKMEQSARNLVAASWKIRNSENP